MLSTVQSYSYRLSQFTQLGLCLLIFSWASVAKCVILDDFEVVEDWNTVSSEEVRVEVAQDTGRTGMAMRLDFDFNQHNGGGFVMVHKALPMTLPANYAFSFYVRADAPDNNFEFKLIDSSGQNVWWSQRRNFKFPQQWEKITIKKRHIDFAWGPNRGELKAAATLELAISAGSGGKGSIWIDELTLEEREPSNLHQGLPEVRASTSAGGHDPASIFDDNPQTSWRSGTIAEEQWLELDFKSMREYGGLVIDWGTQDYAEAYDILVSDNGEEWRRIYSVDSSNGQRDYVSLPDSESRLLRIDLRRSSRGQGYSIGNLEVKPYQFSTTPNRFFESIAKDSARGTYPKYLAGEQSYWTVVGVNGDEKEALINEEGMVEVDKARFSIEPFLYFDHRLITWNDVTLTQELDDAYLPIPSVTWDLAGLRLKITAFAAGETGDSTLYLRYRIINTSKQKRDGKLFLALRPFQVNPPWQTLLTIEGGVGRISELSSDNASVQINNNKSIINLTAVERFGAVKFAQGDITDFLRNGTLPNQDMVFDHMGYASGALEYHVEVPPGESSDVYLIMPFYQANHLSLEDFTQTGVQRFWNEALEDTRNYWRSKLNHIELELPHSPANQKIINTLKSNLAYILINRDGPALQPGSRVYERTWIRDGAIVSAALLKMGHTREVREFIEWYAGYQFSNGKVPCCVDNRGADPVSENDSHGEWIYLIWQYYRYTQDTGLLTEMWPHVLQAVKYIDSLRQQRTTEEYLNPDKRVLYGLLPESISHEGYASNPVHSYWDDFFALRGLKDATDIAAVLGEDEHANQFRKIRDTFSTDLFASIRNSIALHNIDYIPGAAELGDFDPTATTIAITPGGELGHLPDEALSRTFEKYYEILKQRKQEESSWVSYTPYELRVVGTFIRMGDKQRAHEALDFFLNNQRPANWNHWGEIVWQNKYAPNFIGDMPHSWIGAEYIRSLRSLFVYEREQDNTLVLASGVREEWVDNGSGLTLKRLPTYYGTLNYSLRKRQDGTFELNMFGDVTLPPGGIEIHSPVSAPLKGVSVNGTAVEKFDSNKVIVKQFPAQIVLHY